MVFMIAVLVFGQPLLMDDGNWKTEAALRVR
jgi:hypothetical protein